jgi:hypothetical protein
LRLSLLIVCALLVGCYYEPEPIDVATDLSVPDLQPDLTGIDLNTDALRCPNGGLPFHNGELTDPPLDRWAAEALMPITVDPATTTVLLDPARSVAGQGSLRLDTRNGVAGLVYPGTRDAHFDLSSFLYVSFSITADDSAAANDPGWQGAQPHLLLVSGDSDFFEYIPKSGLLPRAPGALVPTTVPLDGGFDWTRNTYGSPDLRRIKYLALTFASWGAGFTVWVDDLQVGPGDFADCP